MKSENGKKKSLPCRIHTRLTQEKYDELSSLLEQSSSIRSLSELLRYILDHTTIPVITYDGTMDKVMEELGAIRKELLSIGVNINQVTRILHQTNFSGARLSQAEDILKEFQQTSQSIQTLFTVMDNLSERWLRK